MNKKYINFVLTGDKNYVVQLAVVMTSILYNIKSTKYTPRFFLFTTDFSDKDIKLISKIKNFKDCEIVNFPMEKYLHYFKQIDVSTFKLQYISLATYFRLLMFKILPDDVDKCFYIDGDMIIDTDLSVLFDELKDNQLASVVVEVLAMSNKEITLKYLNEIDDFERFAKNPWKYPYFNAGFGLYNIRRAKELNLFEQMMDFLQRHPNPPYADQDTLNAVVGQKYAELLNYVDPAYNIFCDIDYSDTFASKLYSKEVLKYAFDNPKIYHFAGGNKPWVNKNVRHFYDVWWRYCKMSPFAKYKPKKHKSVDYTVRLLDVIPFVRYKSNEHNTKFYLFGIPLYGVHKDNKRNQYRLFNLIPVFKIKN